MGRYPGEEGRDAWVKRIRERMACGKTEKRMRERIVCGKVDIRYARDAGKRMLEWFLSEVEMSNDKVEVDGEQLFWAIHSDLPREGPGDDESTLRAFAMLKDLPISPKILDIACGAGPQTLALARNTQAFITAVDNHQPFLDGLARRAAKSGVAERIRVQNMSMFELSFVDQFDVLWSEGAIYIIGFEEGLRAWRPLLKPGGYVAVTEISWLKPNPPAEVFKFWSEAYPGMASVDENLERIGKAGYREIGHFTLPENSWWQPYYHPIEVRVAGLRKKYRDNAEAQSILDGHAEEVEMFRKYSAWYGYVFYVLQVETDSGTDGLRQSG